MFKRLQVTVLMTLLFSLAFGHAFAATNATEEQPPSIKFASSYVSFNDVRVVPAGDENLLVFTLQFHNKEARPLYFRDYFMRLHDAAGQSYTLQRQDGEADSNTIAAGTTRSVLYSARIGKVKSAESLTVSYIRWNQNMPNFEQNLGKVQLKTTPLPSVAQGEQASLSTERHLWNLAVEQFRLRDTSEVSNTSKEQQIEVRLRLSHNDKETLALPQLQYELATADDLRYPLTVTSVDIADGLRPQETATVRLSANLPVADAYQNMRLLVSKPVQVGQAGSFMTPTVWLHLPDAVSSETVSLGQSLTFEGNDGTFGIELSDLYRLPWEEQDLLTAGLELSNQSDRILSLPDLEASFLLDGKIRVQGEWVHPADIIALAPGQQTRLQLVAAIPHAYKFTEIQIPLTVETTIRGQQHKEEAAVFAHSGAFSTIPTVAAGRSHRESRYNLPLTLKVDQVDLYDSSRSQLYSASLQLEHLGERLSTLPQMSAQLELTGGVIYPLSIVRSEAKSEPGAPAIWKLQTSLPKQANIKGATILLGESLQADNSGQSTGYLNPLRLQTPAVDTNVAALLKPLEFGPYQLTFSGFQTPYIYYNELTFGFDYTLTRDALLQIDTRGESLHMEAVDPNGKVWLKRTLALEEAAGGDVLALGTHKLSFKDMLTDMSINRTSYTLNLYHELPSGHRKLLASQEIKWHRGAQ